MLTPTGASACSPHAATGALYLPATQLDIDSFSRETLHSL